MVGRKLRQIDTDLIHLWVAVSHHYILTGERSGRGPSAGSYGNSLRRLRSRDEYDKDGGSSWPMLCIHKKALGGAWPSRTHSTPAAELLAWRNLTLPVGVEPAVLEGVFP